MRIGMHFIRTGIIGSVLTLSSLVPIAAAYAQASFVYNNGYGETIDPTTGAVTGGTQYTVSNQVQSPYLTYAGTTTQHVVYGSAANEGVSRIYSSFTVAQGTFVSLNTLSLDLYVKDTNGTLYDPTTQDPFSAAHFAIYNQDPNNFGDLSTAGGQAAEQAAFKGGDDTFTNNYLLAGDTSFTGNYRFASAADGGNGPADTSRPVFSVGLNTGGLTLGAGTYFFVVSVDVNQSVAPNQNAFAVLADPTDATYGQPLSTNGQNGIYNPNGDGSGHPTYLTDQPEYQNTSSPTILDAFPYTLTGTINSLPEPSALLLIALAGGPLIGGAILRRRKQFRL